MTPNPDRQRVIRTTLRGWLEKRLEAEAFGWLDQTCRALEEGAPERKLFLAYSGAPRRTGNDPLAPDAAEREEAVHARPGWDPSMWTVEQAARPLLLLSLPEVDAESFRATIDKLCISADLNELVAFYQALPLLPHPGIHVDRCREGLRTNMTAVFRAIAHHNPYPCEELSEAAWNQMVLKALFVGAGLDPIVGIDERANPALARMLCEYAHERWSAGRPINPQLWRCVGPHADDAALADLERALKEGDAATREAVLATLARSPHPRARDLLA